jgi:hypothetical protein
MASKVTMPARRDRNAPKFDKTQPRQLRPYFSELESLFADAQVASEKEKKELALRYLDLDTADVWETLDEYDAVTKSYEEFKNAVLELYPGSEKTRRWTEEDLDRLTEAYSRNGIESLGDLAEYHRMFIIIAKTLVKDDIINKNQRNKRFATGFQRALWEKIHTRLQIKDADHDMTKAWEMTEVWKAALVVLTGTTSEIRPALVAASAAISANTGLHQSQENAIRAPERAQRTGAEEVKSEPSLPNIDVWAQALAKALTAQGHGPARPQQQYAQRRDNRDNNGECNFCGETSHYMRDCRVVQEYEAAGKVRRDIHGRVILSTGAFVPRSIPGRYFKERVDEWHRQNPGQLARATLMVGILPETQTAGSADMFLGNNKNARAPFAPTVRTRRQRAEEELRAAVREETGTPDQVPTVGRATTSAPRAPTPPPVRVMRRDEDAPPIHPFAGARDATFPKRRTAPTAAPAVAEEHRDAPYRRAVSAYDRKIATDVFESAMEAPITLTHRQLYSIAPDVRAQTHDALAGKRPGTTTEPEKAQEVRFLDEYADMEWPYEACDGAQDTSKKNAAQLSRDMPQAFTAAVANARPLVAQDPYEAYLRDFPPGQPPADAIVAKESSALRAILPLVDNHLQVESIIDPGCQIVAMSEDVCTALGLAYDPTIVLNMQSANGEIDKSLGLSRNVPFKLGDVTVYLQVHVIRSPAYDILLGRPFDVLTESVVRNFASEEQTITIHDPNTGQLATLPTFARGARRILTRTQGDFRESRNR